MIKKLALQSVKELILLKETEYQVPPDIILFQTLDRKNKGLISKLAGMYLFVNIVMQIQLYFPSKLKSST